MTQTQQTKWANDIIKDIDRAKITNRERCKAVLGRPVPGGYVIVATDGYRALLKKTDTAKGEPVLLTIPQSPAVEVTPHMIGAIRRMKAANSKGREKALVTLDARQDSIMASTIDDSDGTEAREYWPAPVPAVGSTLVNIAYLKVALVNGCRVAWDNGTHPMSVSTPDGSMVYLLMPCRN
jgi:hypothetical protein